MKQPSIVPLDIAGLHATVITCYESTSIYLNDYRAETADPNAPVIHVSPEEINAKRRQDAQKSKPELTRFSNAAIERILIHTALSEYAITQDVLLMHGSALSMDGQCYIFTAVSGTGKSTHARLWREMFGNRVTMINDDKPFLICRSDGITVCGTPWNGKHHLGENATAPLKAIAFLHRAEENRIEPVKPEIAFRYLYPQVYHPKTVVNQAKALSLISRICNNTSFYHLDCNMNPDAALLSYNGMQNEC